ncbi:MAG: nuclear transport factor 2 family protein [Acidobacteria bacterium]|nr:nuclear transport factor 2 family protein [Acidobacteriota bacterium]MBI3489502.1 nuclear transport factor 2 family protein [Acidobacteriota bacterium]
MTHPLEAQILDLEERLCRAMLTSDVRALDELISPDLIFTSHLGQVVGKVEDLELHRSGLLRFQTLRPAEQRIHLEADLAVVSVRMKVSGVFGTSPFAEDLRFTRIWRQSAPGAWQIVAGHSSPIQG